MTWFRPRIEPINSQTPGEWANCYATDAGDRGQATNTAALGVIFRFLHDIHYAMMSRNISLF